MDTLAECYDTRTIMTITKLRFLTVTLLLSALFTQWVHAAPPPPFLAVVEGEKMGFSDNSCTQAAQSVLKQNGFKRIKIIDNIVFAAYRQGRDYHYKAALKCLNKYDLVTITVVTNRNGGLRKAKKLLSLLKNYGEQSDDNNTEGSWQEEDEAVEESEEGKTVLGKPSANFPNCSDGPTLVRCLDSIPENAIDIAQEYLNKRQQ